MGKTYKVKTITNFTDKANKKLRMTTDKPFEVSEDRLKEINGTKNGDLVEVIEEIKAEDPKDDKKEGPKKDEKKK